MPLATPKHQTEFRAEDLHSDIAWFCLRTQWKHEHIAAKHLRQLEGIEVFDPRIRFTRVTRYGSVWITEAMFPGYIFARFEWRTALHRAHYAPGVAGIVHFGSRWPTIPELVISELMTRVGPKGVQVISRDLAAGDKVELKGGAFYGLEAVITKVMPGRQRVAVLMDFLGRQTAVEVHTHSVVKRS